MQAIREYAVVRNGQLVLDISEYFEYMEVEVIILPKNATKPPPKRRAFCKYDISELVKQMPKDYHPEEVKWGKPVGKEIW